MKRHSFDLVSFLFGILFVGMGLTGAFADEDVTFLQVRWLWPVLLITAGLAVVAFTLRRDDRGPEEPPGPYNPID